MKKTRRTFPFFRPRECDGFAEYLKRQSMQGWHFKEWRFGMVFEKGEPKAENYRVEIFPKGADMDMRPGENTKEYAEYCEAAGWKFIDSRGKTCIFKQEVEDAVPIVEPEERFDTILKAEWSEWRNSFLVALLLSAWYFFVFWTMDFEHWAFAGSLLFMLVSMLILAVLGIGDALYLMHWGKKQRQRLCNREEIYYKKERYSANYGRVFFWFVLLFMMVRNIYTPQIAGIWAANLIMIIGLFVISLIVSFWRPLEIANETFQVLSSVGLLFVLSVLIICGVFDQGGLSGTRTEMSEIPLMQEDYNAVEGKAEVFYEESESILGKVCHADVEYSDSEELEYTVYKSPHLWVIDKLWDNVWNKTKPAHDCKELWGAEKAYLTGGEGFYWYYIQYPNAVVDMRIYTEQELKPEDIAVMREKLNLP